MEWATVAIWKKQNGVYDVIINSRLYLAIDWSKRPRNCFSDVWYMTLTSDISVMRKYKMEPRVATGLK